MGCNHLVHLDYQPSVVTGGDTGCLKAGLLTDVSRSLPPQSFHTATLKWQLPLMESDSTSLAILPILRYPYGEQRTLGERVHVLYGRPLNHSGMQDIWKAC